MTEVYDKLAQRADELRKKNNNNRIVIAIAGAPGSGKTTVAAEVARRLDSVIVVPMDGFHYSRAVLDTFDDPAEAHERRGAPFTFDAKGVVELVKKLKSGDRTVYAPTFDHAVKDPVFDDLEINSSKTIVIMEGLYLLLKDDPWNNISKLVDERWFIDIKPAIARQRVAKRHIAAGICDTMEKAYARADGNDYTNGILVEENSVDPDVLVDGELNIIVKE